MESAATHTSLRTLPVAFLATAGGAYWATVRMSGEGCGWTNGLMWGLAWYYLSAAYGQPSRRPFGSGWIVLAMVAGMYFGGMHGYGQFHSWVKGIFHLESDADRSVPISPLLGYWWNLLCGLGWGGVAATFLVWAGAVRRSGWRLWLARFLAVAVLAWAFRAIAVERPDWIMPLYDRVDYTNPAVCPDCARTTRTLVESMMWLGFYAGAILVEAAWRNWRNLGFALLMGVGFAVAFTAFEWLHTLPNFGGAKIGWWKYWETSVGTLGGATLGICFLLFNRPLSNETLEREDIRRSGHYPRAERLLGVWLPLLVSFYMLIQKEAPRFALMLGADAESFVRATRVATLAVLIPVGLYGAYRIGRARVVTQDSTVSPWLFLIPYVLMFLLSYVPQFGKLSTRDMGPYLIQLSIYGVLFLAGFVSLCLIHARTGRKNEEEPR